MICRCSSLLVSITTCKNDEVESYNLHAFIINFCTVSEVAQIDIEIVQG